MSLKDHFNTVHDPVGRPSTQYSVLNLGTHCLPFWRLKTSNQSLTRTISTCLSKGLRGVGPLSSNQTILGVLRRVATGNTTLISEAWMVFVLIIYIKLEPPDLIPHLLSGCHSTSSSRMGLGSLWVVVQSPCQQNVRNCCSWNGQPIYMGCIRWTDYPLLSGLVFTQMLKQ